MIKNFRLSPLYLFFSVFAALVPLNLFAQPLADTQFITHPLHPFSYQQNDQLNGFSVEIVKAMMKNKHVNTDIKMYPFNRAFQMLKEQPNTTLFIIAKRPDREQSMKWIGPIIISDAFFS
ncbi:transporter substrate-binding domain-containing protein [Shewanella sp. H8]|uniref:transporter substrate-binding domain-containing protein n=1 Tax=Shewanella sp. H8 TaxID=3342676 RepID=UPI003315D762